MRYSVKVYKCGTGNDADKLVYIGMYLNEDGVVKLLEDRGGYERKEALSLLRVSNFSDLFTMDKMEFSGRNPIDVRFVVTADREEGDVLDE